MTNTATLRLVLRFALVSLSLVVSARALATERRPVVATLPAKAETAELARLSLLIEARTLASLVASDAVSVLDTKQVLAMLSQEGLDAATLSTDSGAATARALLGADRVITFSLAVKDSTLTLTAAVRDAEGSKPLSLDVKGGPAAWLGATSDALARAVLGPDATLVDVQPRSKSDAAVTALATCWDLALRQPMGLDAPVGLSTADLELAVGSCRKAQAADPTLGFASATLALLLAIARDDAEAEKLLAPGTPSGSALMPSALARYWLATRHQSNQAAVDSLTAVLAKSPGALVLRSFRANTLAAMNEHERAAAAWSEYLALAPSSAFALGRRSRSLARLGQGAKAVEAAQLGLERAPKSREARVVLATRLIEAGQLAQANRTLEPLLAEPTGAAEPMLQLALATAATDCAKAVPLFTSATTRASGPRGARVKGRAFAGVADCEAKLGHVELAKAAWASSVATGVHVKPEPPLAGLVSQAATAPTTGSLYLRVSSGGPAADDAALADQSLRARLEALGASFAPASEEPKAALDTLKRSKLKGYELRLSLEPQDAPGALKVQLIVSSYPERALKGSWMVKATGGKPQKVIPLMVNRVIDDAAGDLEWK